MAYDLAEPMDAEAPAAAPGETHLEVIARLRGLLRDAFAPFAAAASGGPVALLDYPDHANVGDSAIWLGQKAVLVDELLGRPVDLVSTYQMPPEELATFPRDGVVFLHGGGNFGDVWPHHQLFREGVMRACPGMPVVQLPQSIHFADATDLERTRRAIAAHGAFTLFVRDLESLELARAQFACETILCPDSAFAMGPQARRAAPDLDVLLLMRTDKERALAETADALPSGWQAADWLDDEPGLYEDVLRQSKRKALLKLDVLPAGKARRDQIYYNALADRRVERGLRLLSRGRYIITDRLHAHILATLLGIPHSFLDNHYGKIRRFSDAFGTRWNGASAASSFDEAVAQAKSALNNGLAG